MGFFKTNNPSSLIQAIKTFPEKNFEDLLATIQYCLSSSIYPHENTIWMYNDMNVEIALLEHFFKKPETREEVEDKIYALGQIIDHTNLHKNTIPFIEVNLFDEENNLDYIQIQETSSNQKNFDVYSKKNKKNTAQIIAPTLALGGLWFLGKTIGEK
jgi:hypothetical protein